MFRTDLARELTDSFPAYELVCLALDNEPKSEALPFYVHREIGARTLDFGDFFKALVRCVLARETFYRKLFDRRETEFRSLVYELQLHTVKRPRRDSNQERIR